MSHFKLKENMRLGVASSATQIEGYDKANSWYDWYEKGHIIDGADPSIACEHYIRFREDIEIMSDMGIKFYRMGLEWSRIQPQKDSFSQEALEHYREEIVLLKSKGIHVLLTLHHFTNPMWFEEIGGFLNPDADVIFLNYVSKIIHYLGDLVDEYITINEPNVYAVNSYFYGIWPPGIKSFKAVMRVYKTMTLCHIKAYALIHEIRKEKGFDDTKISIANHLRVFEPASRFNPWHVLCAYLMNLLFQKGITKSMLLGKRSFPIGKVKGVIPGKYYDFLGINYYTRSTVSGFKDGVKKGAPVNDLGWEIYPEGIVEVSRRLFKKYQAPIYITENGTCDNDDNFRKEYIHDHLKALSESNLPIAAYYHWCFTDNFEWLEGESARFGLVHIDYETQQRTVKDSGKYFSELIEQSNSYNPIEELIIKKD